MNVIIDRCPFHDRETSVETLSGPMPVRAYQLIVWAGISFEGDLSQPFLVVLDTGHSHNFSIREELLREWAGCEPGAMRRVGTIRVNERLVILRQAELALYPNVPGSRDELHGEPRALEMSQGIVIARQQDPFATRLPTLGMRALARNRLQLVVDGKAMMASITGE